MKISRILMISLVLAACALAWAPMARAQVEVNFWGASAQFFLYSAMTSGNPSVGIGNPGYTPNFLSDTLAAGGAACTAVTWAYDSTGGDYFWAHGTGCPSTASGGVADSSGIIDIKIGYKTSNDAIWSVNGLADSTDATVYCGNVTNATNYMRPMPNGTPPAGQGSTPYLPSTIAPSTASCENVSVAMSDEAAAYFTQISYGNRYGAYYTTTNSLICRQFGGSADCIDGATPSKPAVNDSNLSFWNPMADPGAFYVNTSVQEWTCVGGAHNGDMCTGTGDSGTGEYCGTGGTCTQATLGNISRMMAIQIFTGQIYNWDQFGGGFSGGPIYACMRHTGAGTNVTLDYAVLGDSHGWLPYGVSNMTRKDSSVSKNNPTNQGGPWTWFYDTIPTQLACVNGEISSSTYTSAGSAIGAIGYTDADRSVTATGAAAIGSLTSLPNVAILAYNGNVASRRNVRNGLYDFWSTNFTYYNPNSSWSATNGPGYTVFNALVNYATGQGDNATSTDQQNAAARFNSLAGKGNFWATIGEMNYTKAGANYVPGWTGPAAVPLSP